MTSESCIPDDQLAGAAESRKGSPQRVHLDECPRCQAQLLALQAFLTPPPLPPEARAGEADAELDRFIEQLSAEVRPAPTRGPDFWRVSGLRRRRSRPARVHQAGQAARLHPR